MIVFNVWEYGDNIATFFVFAVVVTEIRFDNIVFSLAKVNRKAPTEAQKKKKDPLAKKRNAAKILALILAVVMVLGMVLPALLWLV